MTRLATILTVVVTSSLTTGLFLFASQPQGVDAARNSSGTYSLPAGNPVVSGNTITTTWANNTMSDVSNEVTDSLSRSNKGAMLAPLRLYSGTQALPGLTFEGDTDTGIWRPAANAIAFGANDGENMRITTSGVRIGPNGIGSPIAKIRRWPSSGFFTNDFPSIAAARSALSLVESTTTVAAGSLCQVSHGEGWFETNTNVVTVSCYVQSDGDIYLRAVNASGGALDPDSEDFVLWTVE